MNSAADHGSGRDGVHTDDAHALIPDGVEESDAALLRRAYELRDAQEGGELYRDWAATYDRTMLDGLGYLTPFLVAEHLADHTRWRDRPVLDVGCGTGIVGAHLAGLGFEVVDGLDMSPEMLAEAGARGCYRSLVTADLTTVLPIETGAYGAIACAGTFTSGHVDARSLAELVRIVEPGGVLTCSVHHSVWEPGGFATTFERMVADGVLRIIEVTAVPYYRTSTATDGRICTYERL